MFKFIFCIAARVLLFLKIVNLIILLKKKVQTCPLNSGQQTASKGATWLASPNLNPYRPGNTFLPAHYVPVRVWGQKKKTWTLSQVSIFSSRVLSGRLPTLPLLISSLILHDTSSESLPNTHFQENSPLIPSHNIFCFSFTAIIKMCHHLLISTTICLMRRCWVCSSLQTQCLS